MADNDFKDPRKAALKKVLMLATTVGVSPLIVAAPASAEQARSQLAFLRGVGTSGAQLEVQHPVLQDILAAAKNPSTDDKDRLAHTNGHTNSHTNSCCNNET